MSCSHSNMNEMFAYSCSDFRLNQKFSSSVKRFNQLHNLNNVSSQYTKRCPSVLLWEALLQHRSTLHRGGAARPFGWRHSEPHRRRCRQRHQFYLRPAGGYAGALSHWPLWLLPSPIAHQLWGRACSSPKACNPGEAQCNGPRVGNPDSAKSQPLEDVCASRPPSSGGQLSGSDWTDRIRATSKSNILSGGARGTRLVPRGYGIPSVNESVGLRSPEPERADGHGGPKEATGGGRDVHQHGQGTPDTDYSTKVKITQFFDCFYIVYYHCCFSHKIVLVTILSNTR